MFVKKCHPVVAAFLICLLSCEAADLRSASIIADQEHGASSSGSAAGIGITTPLAKSDSSPSSTVLPKLQADTPTSVSSISSSPVTPVVTKDPHAALPAIGTSSTGKPEAATSISKDDATSFPPVPTASTVKPDPDTTTVSTSTTSVTPPTTTTITTTTSKTTTTGLTTPKTPVTTITPPPSSSTTASTTTSLKPPVTTVAPVTPTPVPHTRQFDGPSFIGGIVLATGLMAIGFVAFKFYKARTERNYHTL